MWLELGAEISSEVREYFKEGFKSGNKMYDIQDDDEKIAARKGGAKGGPLAGKHRAAFRARNAQKKRQRNERRETANDMVQDLRKLTEEMTLLQEAEMLYQLPAVERAGNCSEMAVIAGYLALEKNGDLKPDQVFQASIRPPGDHTFCLLAPTTLQEQTNFPTVTDFTRSQHASTLVIIDPWLNVVCLANQYLMLAGLKLQKWGGAGKRLLWAHGSVGRGWYPPHGEYRRAFAEAPVVLYSFAEY